MCDDKKQSRQGMDTGEWVSTDKIWKIVGCRCRWDTVDNSYLRLALWGFLVGIRRKRSISTGVYEQVLESQNCQDTCLGPSQAMGVQEFAGS